jgi:membrane-bound serine protease (ClpP class)
MYNEIKGWPAMEFFSNPNVVYLLLVGGLVFATLALIAPGTGVLELGAFFVLGLAGWCVYTYDLPLNWWALIGLLAGIILFFLAVRRPKQIWLLVLSVVCLVAGSAFLFRTGADWYPAVNPLLAAAVSTLTAGYFWLAAHKVMEAEQTRPRHDLDALIGATGEAKSPVHEEGSVQVAGELWSASSDQPIPQDARVRVVAREGFKLKVEAVNPPPPAP